MTIAVDLGCKATKQTNKQTNKETFHSSLAPITPHYMLGSEIMKDFPFSTQLSTKFILLINVKMPTIVGILTFISMINTTSERLKARNCRFFSFYEQLKFRAQLT